MKELALLPALVVATPAPYYPLRCRARVPAAFLADAIRCLAGRAADAFPPKRPPFFAGARLIFLPRPEPPFSPAGHGIYGRPGPRLGDFFTDAAASHSLRQSSRLGVFAYRYTLICHRGA